MRKGIGKEQLREIKKQYRLLLSSCGHFTSDREQALIRQAFKEALVTFRDHMRDNGDPYFIHAISVARIVAQEMELDSVSIIAALLKELPAKRKDAGIHLESNYGKTVKEIILNLKRVSELRMQKVSINSENFIQLLLTISVDIRVILIQLADRLELMRNIHLLPLSEQVQVSLETSALYAPLAHRLGLYRIKTELEELAMKHSYPEVFDVIRKKIEESREEQNQYFRVFIEPIEKALATHHLNFEIKYRLKSIPSIWNKMKKQQIDFDQIYDYFAIRIILNTSKQEEKSDCWKAYSLVTNIYAPNAARLRDWISAPKANGYESLHTTVIGPRGKWIEVQIRSRRMDESAEKGTAAHWKYKEQPDSASTVAETSDKWLGRIRSVLENYTPGDDEIDQSAKMELFSDFVYAYTPQGDLKKLKTGATVLDFAFDIHSEIGQHCSGAKVNDVFVPLKHILKTGDQVEIITSKNQKPTKDWLTFVTTSKAVTKIKRVLKDEEFSQAETGKGILLRKLNQLKLDFSDELANKLVNYFRSSSTLDLFHGIAEGKYEVQKIKEALLNLQKPEEPKSIEKPFTRVVTRTERKSHGKSLVIINENTPLDDIKLAKCCQPVYGDAIFGFVTVTEGIKIHRTDCTNAPQMYTSYAYRVVPARSAEDAEISAYVASIRITGEDRIGILNSITDLITKELNANIRSINLSSKDGKFEGTLSVNVDGKSHLDRIIARLAKLKGIRRVVRIH